MMMVNTIEWWASTIIKQGAVYFPGGSGKVSPIDPMDVASVAAAVLTQSGHEGQIYPLTGPEVLTVSEMVQVVAQVLVKPLRYMNVPGLLAVVWLRSMGHPSFLVKALNETLVALRKNEYGYITTMVELTTKKSPRTFEQWCQENIHQFKE